MAAFFMGMNLHLVFSCRVSGAPFLWLIVLAVRADTSLLQAVGAIAPLLGQGEDCCVKKAWRECGEVRMAPCGKSSSFEGRFSFPCLQAPTVAFSLLILVAGSVMSSGKDCVFLCLLALPFSFLSFFTQPWKQAFCWLLCLLNEDLWDPMRWKGN